MDNSLALAVDPSPRASLLLGHVPTGMLPRRASPAGRLDRDHRSICPFAGPSGPYAAMYHTTTAALAIEITSHHQPGRGAGLSSAPSASMSNHTRSNGTVG